MRCPHTHDLDSDAFVRGKLTSYCSPFNLGVAVLTGMSYGPPKDPRGSSSVSLSVADSIKHPSTDLLTFPAPRSLPHNPVPRHLSLMNFLNVNLSQASLWGETPVKALPK